MQPRPDNIQFSSSPGRTRKNGWCIFRPPSRFLHHFSSVRALERRLSGQRPAPPLARARKPQVANRSVSAYPAKAGRLVHFMPKRRLRGSFVFSAILGTPSAIASTSTSLHICRLALPPIRLSASLCPRLPSAVSLRPCYLVSSSAPTASAPSRSCPHGFYLHRPAASLPTSPARVSAPHRPPAPRCFYQSFTASPLLPP